MALVLAAFLILVPVLGVFTPRPGSQHYVAGLRDDLRQRSGKAVEMSTSCAASSAVSMKSLTIRPLELSYEARLGRHGVVAIHGVARGPERPLAFAFAPVGADGKT